MSFEKFDQHQRNAGASTSGRRGGGILSCLGCCVRQPDTADTQPLNVLNHRNHNSFDDVLEKSAAARTETWERLGALEPLVLSHLVNPALLGGPKWPALRQQFRVVQRSSNGNVIIASDGLSDPFDDMSLGEGNVNGFGLEFYIETPAGELAEGMQDIKSSWQFQLLYTVSQLAAGHGSIRSILDDMKLLSTEAEGVHDAIPDAARSEHVNGAGRVGALLGLKPETGDVPPRIDNMPLTDVNLVNIKLLTLKELQLITEKGAAGRQQLSQLFDGPDRQISSLKRPSVV